MVPEFIFGEYGQFRIDGVDKSFGVLAGIKWQIKDTSSQLVVLADLVSRRREKRYNN